MRIQVLNPGVLSTFQDKGRHHFQAMGVSVCGAMNHSALQLANLLVGNPPTEAALEISLTGPRLRFEQAACIALSGSMADVFIETEQIPMNRPCLIRAGQTLHFRQSHNLPMTRIYLAVHGGFELPEIMGSHSTDLKTGMGGYLGRALQKQDLINIRKPLDPACQQTLAEFLRELTIYLPASLGLQKKNRIRILKGHHWEHFTAEAQEKLLNSTYTISPQSERMGYRLQGHKLALKEPLQILSEPTAFGSVQVPPDGNPIILMADRQTTGGYPKIANIISADLPVLAQYLPGEEICFDMTTLCEAQNLLLQREIKFQNLRAQLAPVAMQLAQCYLSEKGASK